MKTFVQPGRVLTLAAPYSVDSGDGLLVGAIFGVAQHDAASGAEVAALVEGVVDLPKAAGEIVQGAAVYWDDSAKVVTTTSEGNTRIGAATETAASGADSVRVRLNASF